MGAEMVDVDGSGAAGDTMAATGAGPVKGPPLVSRPYMHVLTA